MLLRDSLDDAVADVTADLHTLTTASRREGLALRRRRRSTAAVGSVAAMTAVAVGGHALVSGGGGQDPAVATELAAPVVSGPLGGETAPITAGGVAAALAASVDAVADGTFSRFQGEVAHDLGLPAEGLAALLFEPAGGSGPAGQVFINLQPAAAAGERPYGCEGYLTEYIVDCTSQKLPSGDTLRTYREDDDTEIGIGSQRVVAEVIRPEERLRVVVYAMNTNPWVTGEFRDQTVLTTEQLIEIASQPWWSRTDLPVEHVEAGETLDLDEG